MSARRVSVVIPAYRSDRTVADCLEALRRQSFRDFEVILVNSSPADRTREIVTTGFPEVAFEESAARLLPHEARTRGLRRASGAIFVFTDPDCRARPDWLQLLVAAHDEGRSVVGGSMDLARVSWQSCAVHIAKFSWLLPGLPPGPVSLIPTANASYSRAAFEAAGPFRGELFVGDALLAWRAARRGFPPWFEPRAVVEHHHDFGVAAYAREFFVRGRELGRLRPRALGWTRLRALAQALAWPLVAAVLVGRAGRAAHRAGWGWRFWSSLPLVVLYKAAWALGETLSGLELAAAALFGGPPSD